MSLFDPGGIKQNYENKSFRECFRGTLRMSLRKIYLGFGGGKFARRSRKDIEVGRSQGKIKILAEVH